VSCSTEQSKKRSPQDILSNNFTDSPDKVLSETIQKILGEAPYNEFKIDTSSTDLSINDGSISVFFKKLNKIADGKYIVDSEYLVGVKQNTTNKYSRNFIFLGEEVIELNDSTWDRSIRLLTYPRFKIIDYDGCGTKELLIKQRVSNGTMYHAVREHFFDIDTSTLNLNYKFSIETISYLPIYGSYIYRTIENNKVKVYLTQDKNEKGKLIGEYILSFDKSNGVFNAINTKVYNEDYKGLLITSSPTGILPSLNTGLP